MENRREQLIAQVESILASAADGRVQKTKETQSVDFKEEAGRRNGPQIEPGKPENPEAADKLADEVACMANTPGGGALIVGIEDKTGRIIGTELDIDWLRQGIFTRIDVVPDVVAKRVLGQRVLAIYVAAAAEPIEDTSDRLRWRVGDSCRPVDRGEWWEYQRAQAGFDLMAQVTTATLGDARPAALTLARKWDLAFAELTDEELLRGIGALDAEGFLSQAGKLLFTSLDRTAIELSIFDVHGGQVLNTVVPEPEKSCLEQLDYLEQALNVVNKNNTVVEGFVHKPVPEIPRLAVREAMLNAMIHRDWNRSEPIDVRWIELDSTLIVRSPGGFPAAITSENVLSNRAARYPALADLYRALGLVDKQGVGVDRMYQAMIALGHRPPTIEEIAGPFVETTLVGGRPVLPVLELVSSIVPEARQDDYRIAIVLYLLFQRPFITIDIVARGLQSGKEAARNALEAARQTTVAGEPLIIAHDGVWLLGSACREILRKVETSPFSPVRYLSTDQAELTNAAMLWLSEVGDLATSDLMAMCGVSRGTAKACVDGLVDEERVIAVGGGRSRRYRLVE
ncbi:transcriptional regulator [Corynebacterium diphtheriae]|nr:transcriptional regulator [Corynebacterium diphtheriae]CAB1013035.1 transcriptional regulator [Corynebacterium diphtheriae]